MKAFFHYFLWPARHCCCKILTKYLKIHNFKTFEGKWNYSIINYVIPRVKHPLAHKNWNLSPHKHHKLSNSQWIAINSKASLLSSVERLSATWRSREREALMSEELLVEHKTLQQWNVSELLMAASTKQINKFCFLMWGTWRCIKCEKIW